MVLAKCLQAPSVPSVQTRTHLIGHDRPQKENPKLDPAPDSNTAKPPEEWVSGDEPMTGAQASYLTTPRKEVKRPPPGGDLTKAQASKLIDELKAELGR
jgi:hypothetical protein